MTAVYSETVKVPIIEHLIYVEMYQLFIQLRRIEEVNDHHHHYYMFVYLNWSPIYIKNYLLRSSREA